MILSILALIWAHPTTPETKFPDDYLGTWSPTWAQCNAERAEFARLYVEPEEFRIHRDRYFISEFALLPEDIVKLVVRYQSHDMLEGEGISEPFEVILQRPDSSQLLEMTIGDEFHLWERCPLHTDGEAE